MPLIDRYIIRQLIPIWIFSLSICTILGEIIGISFEQVDFIIEQNFPLIAVLQVHLFKLPAFLSLALPFSLLIANFLLYTRLSKNNEIIAFLGFGVHIYRIISASIIFSILVLLLKFVLDASVVPIANYQAAMVIENEFKVERNILQKYHNKNIIYQELSKLDQKQSLKYLIFAARFDSKKLHDVNILEFQEKKLNNIIVANTVIWNQELKLWDFYNGTQYMIENHNYQEVKDFEKLSLPLDKNLLSYVQNYRDNREMTLSELHKWLSILKRGNNSKKIRQLQIDIKERYTLPFSCIVFALLGAVLGCNRQIATNNISSIILIIFGYQATQFLSNSVCLVGLMPISIGVWIPNIIGIASSTLLLDLNTNCR